MKDFDDPPIDEIQAIRREIAGRFNNDLARLGAYYLEQQERHGSRPMIGPESSVRSDAVEGGRTPVASR